MPDTRMSAIDALGPVGCGDLVDWACFWRLDEHHFYEPYCCLSVGGWSTNDAWVGCKCQSSIHVNTRMQVLLAEHCSVANFTRFKCLRCKKVTFFWGNPKSS